MPYSFPRASCVLSYLTSNILYTDYNLGKKPVKKVLWIKAMMTAKKPVLSGSSKGEILRTERAARS